MCHGYIFIGHTGCVLGPQKLGAPQVHTGCTIGSVLRSVRACLQEDAPLEPDPGSTSVEVVLSCAVPLERSDFNCSDAVKVSHDSQTAENRIQICQGILALPPLKINSFGKAQAQTRNNSSQANFHDRPTDRQSTVNKVDHLWPTIFPSPVSQFGLKNSTQHQQSKLRVPWCASSIAPEVRSPRGRGIQCLIWWPRPPSTLKIQNASKCQQCVSVKGFLPSGSLGQWPDFNLKKPMI